MAKAERQTWVWWFDQPPERLWPLLADTPRFNEAMGLPKYQVEEIPRPDGTDASDRARHVGTVPAGMGRGAIPVGRTPWLHPGEAVPHWPLLNARPHSGADAGARRLSRFLHAGSGARQPDGLAAAAAGLPRQGRGQDRKTHQGCGGPCGRRPASALRLHAAPVRIRRDPAGRRHGAGAGGKRQRAWVCPPAGRPSADRAGGRPAADPAAGAGPHLGRAAAPRDRAVPGSGQDGAADAALEPAVPPLPWGQGDGRHAGPPARAAPTAHPATSITAATSPGTSN